MCNPTEGIDVLRILTGILQEIIVRRDFSGGSPEAFQVNAYKLESILEQDPLTDPHWNCDPDCKCCSCSRASYLA